MPVVGPCLGEPAGEDLSPPGVEHGEHIRRARERGGGQGGEGGVLREGDPCARRESAGRRRRYSDARESPRSHPGEHEIYGAEILPCEIEGVVYGGEQGL